MINWDEQWALHARNFSNGFAHVSLADYGSPAVSFKLAPGPGFGDLSHPTTRIMLELMPKKIQQPVIDIGCGSGVLSIAAKCLGASEVSGIDIDEEAIRHAKSNSALNGCNCYFGKTLPSIPKNPLILMNMISSEQKLAWREEFVNYTLIVSGFPVEEKDPQHYGLITTKKELDGWKGFIIKKGDF